MSTFLPDMLCNFGQNCSLIGFVCILLIVTFIHYRSSSASTVVGTVAFVNIAIGGIGATLVALHITLIVHHSFSFQELKRLQMAYRNADDDLESKCLSVNDDMAKIDLALRGSTYLTLFIFSISLILFSIFTALHILEIRKLKKLGEKQ